MSKKVRVVIVFSCIFLVSIFFINNASAERPQEGIGQWLQEVGVFSGYLSGDLDGQDDLEAIPLGLRFGFDLKPFTEKFGFEPKGMLELVYEPVIGTIFGPRNNAEMSLSFLFKYSYPLTDKLYPFIEVGTGLYYMTLKTAEQSTQFNFASQGGAGITYFLRPDLAVNVTYRIRHVSNCSIKDPNSGIESNEYLAGFSYYF